MNTTKRLISLLMVVMMVLGIFPVFIFTGSADLQPNDDFLTAEVLPPLTAMTGSVNSSDDTDTYKFAVVGAQKITVTLEVLTSVDDLWGELYWPDQGKIDDTAYLPAGKNEQINHTSGLDTTGDYYYKVRGGEGTYELTLTVTNQNDAGLGIDAGDTLVTATPITNGTYNGWIADDDEADIYSFVVTKAQILSVDLKAGTTGSGSMWCDVYDPLKNKMMSTGYLALGINETLEYTTSFATAGVYYAKVTGAHNDYQFKVKVTDQNDSLLGIDASDTNTAPTMITPGLPFNGWIADDDKKDIYGFNVVKAQKVAILLKTGTKGTDDLWIDFYGPDKNKILSTSYVKPDVSETITYVTSHATAGLHYIVVTGGDNTYTTKVTITDQNDAGLGTDAGDNLTASSAVPGVAVGAGKTSYTGYIFDADQNDFYNVTLKDGQILNLELKVGTTSPTEDQWMVLYNPLKEQEVSTDYINPGVTGTIKFTTSLETGGVYYFKITGGDNDYTFTVEIVNQTDGGGTKDAPGDFTNPVWLKTGSYTGWVADEDDADYYNISVKANHVFTVNFTSGPGGTGSMALGIYDSTKSLIETLYSAPEVKATFTLAAGQAPLTNSVYYLKVYDGDQKTYKVDVYLPELPPDTTTPTVTILTPVLGMAFKLPGVTITGTATDTVGTISKVEWALDNATWNLCTGQGAWVCNVTLLTGANKVTIKATDNSNNKGYRDITLHFDGAVPSLNVTGLTDGTKVKKSKMTITGTAADNVGVAKVEVQVNGGAWETATGTTAWSHNIVLKSGKNTVVIKVTDTAGNTVEVTRNVEYKKETAGGGFIPGFEAVVLLVAALVAVLVLSNRKKN